jgi:hypothetical protein
MRSRSTALTRDSGEGTRARAGASGGLCAGRRLQRGVTAFLLAQVLMLLMFSFKLKPQLLLPEINTNFLLHRLTLLYDCHHLGFDSWHILGNCCPYNVPVHGEVSMKSAYCVPAQN